jgi:hypothetical protein
MLQFIFLLTLKVKHTPVRVCTAHTEVPSHQVGEWWSQNSCRSAFDSLTLKTFIFLSNLYLLTNHNRIFIFNGCAPRFVNIELQTINRFYVLSLTPEYSFHCCVHNELYLVWQNPDGHLCLNSTCLFCGHIQPFRLKGTSSSSLGKNFTCMAFQQHIIQHFQTASPLFLTRPSELSEMGRSLRVRCGW